MRKAVKTFLALCVAIVPAIALCACGGDKSSDSSKIVVGIPQDLEDSLDPHEAVAAGTKEILFNIYEGLYKPDSDGNIVPAVAESYTVSEDGLVYSFTLRDGVKFHNGKPVTAEDVVYSLKKSAGMTGKESLIAAFSNIKDISSTGDKNVTVTLNEADVDFLAYIANTNACIIPADNDKSTTNPIGTGPYMYVSRSPQEEIVLKKFDEYWGTPANIENVVLKVVADADSIVMNLNGGSVDMFFHLSTVQIEQLNKNFGIYEGEMNLVQAIYLNNAFEPFSDVRVRKALSLAVDVPGVLALTSDGKGFPIGSSMFPSFGKYYTDLTAKNAYNPEEAKKLLKEAGYENNLSFTITVPSNYQQHVDCAQVVSQQLKEVGVTADIQLIEWSSWLSDVYSGRNFEATCIGVDASSLTASALLSRFVSDAHNNFINFNNPEYDAIYKEILATTDDDARTKMYKQLLEILADDAANIYIQDMIEYVALSDKFDGYTFYPMYIQDFAKLKLK